MVTNGGGNPLNHKVRQVLLDLQRCEGCHADAVIGIIVQELVPTKLISTAQQVFAQPARAEAQLRPVRAYKFCLWCGRREYLTVVDGMWKIVEARMFVSAAPPEFFPPELSKEG